MDGRREQAFVAEIMEAVEIDCRTRGEEADATWFNVAARLASVAHAVCGVRAKSCLLHGGARGGPARKVVVVELTKKMMMKGYIGGEPSSDLLAALGRDSAHGEPMTPKRSRPALPGIAVLACAVAHDRRARKAPITEEEGKALREFIYKGPSVWQDGMIILRRVMSTGVGPSGAALTSLIDAVAKNAASSHPAWIPAADYALNPFLAACRVLGVDTTLRGEGESSVEETLRQRMQWAGEVVTRMGSRVSDHSLETEEGLALLARVAAEYERRRWG